MLSTPSNTSLRNVQLSVRNNALMDLAYFCNTLFGMQVDERICGAVQECVEEHFDAVVETKQPSRLAGYVATWLSVQGFGVVDAPRVHVKQEMLDWLGLEDLSNEDSLCVSVTATRHSLQITWLT